jgi:phosphoribosylformylglycinamidine cyclo-ligase
VLPQGCQAVLEQSAWRQPQIFDWLQREGSIDPAEMHRVFNCGIGMVLVVDQASAQACVERLRALGETAACIGSIVARPEGAAPTIVI